jgi:dihydrofolate synthase/folylpolyglutamate synthase
MSYQTAVEQMYELGHELAQSPARKFDLDHMRVLLGALGNPEQGFPNVLVAGTNGKGSTAATLAAILQASGLTTGLYTSPHLIRINERIRVNSESISDQDFEKLHDRVDQAASRLVNEGRLPWHPSFFEMLTAMAFEYFSGKNPDIVVLEVGMGGRLDATNVVNPRLSIITDISLDHQKFLGETIAEIAREKAGIIRKGGAVVTLPQMPDANDVIGNLILDLGARAVNAVLFVPPVSPGSAHTFSEDSETIARNRYPLDVMGSQIQVDSPLSGRHQLRNVALAIAAAEELHTQGFAQITPLTIEEGIRVTRWPGRFQRIAATDDSPDYILDVAHNPAGAWALRSTLSSALDNSSRENEITLIFGVMRDKAMREMTEILFPIARRVIVTQSNNPRSATPTEIRAAAERSLTQIEIEQTEDVVSALQRACQITGAGGVVVVTGSIYVVGEAMQTLGIGI